MSFYFKYPLINGRRTGLSDDYSNMPPCTQIFQQQKNIQIKKYGPFIHILPANFRTQFFLLLIAPNRIATQNANVNFDEVVCENGSKFQVTVSSMVFHLHPTPNRLLSMKLIFK